MPAGRGKAEGGGPRTEVLATAESEGTRTREIMITITVRFVKLCESGGESPSSLAG